jgi:hypothetical protein
MIKAYDYLFFFSSCLHRPDYGPNRMKTLREAVKVVKEGKPALVDVVCQMR